MQLACSRQDQLVQAWMVDLAGLVGIDPVVEDNRKGKVEILVLEVDTSQVAHQTVAYQDSQQGQEDQRDPIRLAEEDRMVEGIADVEQTEVHPVVDLAVAVGQLRVEKDLVVDSELV